MLLCVTFAYNLYHIIVTILYFIWLESYAYLKVQVLDIINLVDISMMELNLPSNFDL